MTTSAVLAIVAAGLWVQWAVIVVASGRLKEPIGKLDSAVLSAIATLLIVAGAVAA